MVGGRRAYALARSGQEVELPERTVTIHRCEERWRDPPRVGLEVECSAGTYIRTLVADLGDAYCLALRRTAIGPFDVADAGRFVPLDDALAFLPAVELAGDAARRAAHGVAVPAPPAATVVAADVVRLRDAAGLIALAEARGDGTLKPVVGFRG